MKKFVVVLLLILSSFSGCQKEKELTLYNKSSLNAGFDTIFQLVGYAYSEEEFDEYFQTMVSEAYRYHQLYDKYHEYEGINNIYTINENAGIAPVKVEQEIIDLLLLSKEWTEKTDGIFDITFGAVLSIWHDYREEGKALNSEGKYGYIPSTGRLEEAAQYTGWDFIEIDEEKQTVYISDSRLSLDVGAVAKGYTVEKIAQLLEEAGFIYGNVNGGGNVRIINHKPDGTAWKVGVDIPDAAGEIEVFKLPQSNSVVTSGDYARYYIVEGDIRLQHIIDTRTLFPAQNARSVTIVYPDSGIADILSTVLTVLDYDEGVAFINQYNSTHPEQEVGALWIFMDAQNQHEGYSEIVSGQYVVYISDNLLVYSTLFGE